MKLVYVSTSAIPSRTANSIHVMKMAQAFQAHGVEVTLLAPRLPDEPEPGHRELADHYGVTGDFTLARYTAFRGPFRTPLNVLSVLKIIRRIHPDFVYGRYAPASAAACLSGYPTALEVHSPVWRDGAMARLSLWLVRRSRNFRKLVVISQALKNMFLKDGKFPEHTILVAHDGADVPGPQQILLEVTGRLRAGYFGHLYKGRGIELILEIAGRLPDVEFHVFGGNEKEIQHWTVNSSLSNVTFHGFVEPGLVPAYRQSCDILLAPYQTEVAISGGTGNTSAYMSPLKIFEYMSQNRAIVCSDLPVLREVLSEENALLVPPGDARAWVNAIERLRDEALRSRLADKAYRDFLEHYTWKRRAKLILAESGFLPRADR